MKMAESEKIVLESCIIDFDYMQVSFKLRHFSLSLNACKVMMVFFNFWSENIKKASTHARARPPPCVPSNCCALRWSAGVHQREHHQCTTCGGRHTSSGCTAWASELFCLDNVEAVRRGEAPAARLRQSVAACQLQKGVNWPAERCHDTTNDGICARLSREGLGPTSSAVLLLNWSD